MRRKLSALVSVVLAVSVVGLGGGPALADFPQRRITHFGADGDLDKQASFPDVAFNPRTKEYLVVYMAGTDTDENHWVIYGQRVRAGGALVGHRIRISSPSGRYLCSYEPPSVEYARNIDEFLVTWDEGRAADCDDAIYVRRISGDGDPLGARAKRISDRGYTDIETTMPAYNPQRQEWMVAWNAEAPDETGGIQQLWAQRLNDRAQEVGVDDLRLTDPDVDDFDTNDAMGIAFDPQHQRYLVVVRGITASLPSPFYEVYGHMMGARGGRLGPPQFRISHVADTNPTTGQVRPPMVGYDPTRSRFLVVWTGNPELGAMAPNEVEISGRLVRPDRSLVGANDRRLSFVGTDGDDTLMPVRPDIGFNPFLEQFLLAWSGDDDDAGGVDEESEVWGQRVGVGGSLIGTRGFRVSHSGPDADPDFAANRPALAFDAGKCRYLAVWASGDVGNWGGATQEWDIYANVLPSRCPRR
jgi:hypothetical protein